MFADNYFKRWFLIIFALFCVGINVIAFTVYQKSQDVANSKFWVEHTYQVIAEEYNLFAALQDMQTTQRTFLINGSDIFLVPYNKARIQIEKSTKKLEYLVKDNQSQESRVKENSAKIYLLLSLVQSQIDTKKSQHMPVENIDFTANKVLLDDIRMRHAAVVDEEKRLLDIRTQRVENQRRNFISTLFLTAALSAIGLLVANGFVAFLTYRRKSAEDELRRTNKEMEGFTYIASHDLRSPLVNLKGFSSEMKYSLGELNEILERNKDKIPDDEFKKIQAITDSDLPDALRYIHSSVEKMDKLTNAILELSRLGRRNLDLKLVDPNLIVKHILETLHHTITSKNIQMKILPMPLVVADPLSLEHVFGNIIDNAIKYLDPERTGKIEIGGSKAYREIKFWVKDNGRGISESDYQKVFEIYRRAGNTEAIPGEGMGMAYVRTTLRRLGGQIWVESTHKVGTTFYFTISNTLKKDQPR